MTTHRIASVKLVAVFTILIVASVIDMRRNPVPTSSTSGDRRDIELFGAVVARVAAGEGYYDAMGFELRERKYPTASVFNWRTPLLYTATATISSIVTRVILILLACALLVLTALVVRKRSTSAAIIGLFVQCGAVVPLVIPGAMLFTEAWAGVMLGLSLCAYELGAGRRAAIVGIGALFVRELAAPYVALCALFALIEKRRGELIVWIVGAAAYSLFFAWHASQVHASHHVGDLSHAHSWLYFGGPAFLLQTLRTNAWVILSPSWLPSASVLLSLIVAAAAWHQPGRRLRATAPTYAALFLVFGQPFNFYWGLLTAPLWALAAAYGVDAVRDWFGTLRRTESPCT
jgi:hypothetical protein